MTRPRKTISLIFMVMLCTAAMAYAGEGSIVFASSASGNWDLWVVSPDSKEQIQLTHSAAEEHSPAVSPDGGEIAFVRDRALWVMDLKNRTEAALPLDEGIYAHPDWSPDATALVYVKYKVMPSDSSEMWMIRRSEHGWGEPERISVFPPMRLYPRFSPDGQQLVFSEFRRDRNLGVIEEIGIYDLKNKTYNTLTDNRADSFMPVWGAGGKFIAYGSNETGNYDLWLMKVKTGERIRLTRETSYDAQPSFSPQGTELAFVSTRSGSKELWIMPIGGGAARQLTDMKSPCKDPYWSAKGIK